MGYTFSSERTINGKKYRFIAVYTGWHRIPVNWDSLVKRLKQDGYKEVIVRKIPESGSRDEKGIYAGR